MKSTERPKIKKIKELTNIKNIDKSEDLYQSNK
jgi:hypothetical protein